MLDLRTVIVVVVRSLTATTLSCRRHSHFFISNLLLYYFVLCWRLFFGKISWLKRWQGVVNGLVCGVGPLSEFPLPFFLLIASIFCS